MLVKEKPKELEDFKRFIKRVEPNVLFFHGLRYALNEYKLCHFQNGVVLDKWFGEDDLLDDRRLNDFVKELIQ